MQLSRLTAIGGLLGATAMFVGDLFLYAHWGTAGPVDPSIQSRIPFRTSILLASELHLDISALLGGVAACGYLIGAFHISQRFELSVRKLGYVTGFLFGLGALFGGIYHAFWSLYGKALQASIANPALYADHLDSLETTLNIMNTAAATPSMLALLVFFAAVISGKTSFPRFFAALTPLPLILVSGALLTPLAEAASPPINSLIKGTNFNIVMMIFFFSALIQVKSNSSKSGSHVENAA